CGAARVAEHAPRAPGGAVGQAELGEAAGGAVLEPPQHLDVAPDQLGLVALGCDAPVVEAGEVGRGYVTVEPCLLEVVAVAQPGPVEVGPALGLAERGAVAAVIR